MKYTKEQLSEMNSYDIVNLAYKLQNELERATKEQRHETSPFSEEGTQIYENNLP